MRQELSFITVSTSDLDAVRRFYVDGLGWSPLLDVAGEIVFFQVGHGLVLGFFEASHFVRDFGGSAEPALANTVPDAAAAPTSARPGGFTVSQNVDSRAAVDEVIAQAEAAGATIAKRPQRADFGGYHAHFVDPVGVVWEIAHNSGWHVEPDGTVVLGPIVD
jgi:catechol 2,3-dioxygenase-like lactoylglutathione lyase family enzyme